MTKFKCAHAVRYLYYLRALSKHQRVHKLSSTAAVLARSAQNFIKNMWILFQLAISRSTMSFQSHNGSTSLPRPRQSVAEIVQRLIQQLSLDPLQAGGDSRPEAASVEAYKQPEQ